MKDNIRDISNDVSASVQSKKPISLQQISKIKLEIVSESERQKMRIKSYQYLLP